MDKDEVNENTENPVKKPWYLSTWFIVLVFIVTFMFTLGIPAIILAIVRFVKYKENRVGSGILMGSTIAIPTLLIAMGILSIIMTGFVGNEEYKETQKKVATQEKPKEEKPKEEAATQEKSEEKAEAQEEPKEEVATQEDVQDAVDETKQSKDTDKQKTNKGDADSNTENKKEKEEVADESEENQEQAENKLAENQEQANNDIEDSEEEAVGITGDFEQDVLNGTLYGEDGKIVDSKGNAISEYAEYFITEDGYISNGDWVLEGYIMDNAGKITVNEVMPQVQNPPTQFEQIQNMIDMANKVDIETLMRSPSQYNNTNVCLEADLCVDGFFNNFYISGNGESIRIFPSSTVDESGNNIEQLLSGDHVLIVGSFRYHDYQHEYLGEMQSTIDNAIVILLK